VWETIMPSRGKPLQKQIYSPRAGIFGRAYHDNLYQTSLVCHLDDGDLGGEGDFDQ